ncbi:MAG: T9SS type A sorting domain-containing protein, partial [Bacteroidales bacterium]|nr:T9SS type A sorting domain-containing protein [Bacteroidales bacterium]
DFIIGQNIWGDDGNVWYYTQRTLNPNVISYCTIENISDTVIDGIYCNKYRETEFFQDITYYDYHYIHSSGDSILFYADGKFNILYDFGAEKGDTIILDYYKTFNNESLKVIVDSVGELIVNEKARKIQYVTSGDGMTIEFGGYIIEGIGNTMYMFPTFDQTNKGPLRCFIEGTEKYINPYYNESGWNGQDCDQILIFSDIENLNFNKIKIFPNPVNEVLYFESCYLPISYSIYSIDGNILKNGILIEGQSINISELNQGIYFLKLLYNESYLLKKFIKL